MEPWKISLISTVVYALIALAVFIFLQNISGSGWAAFFGGLVMAIIFIAMAIVTLISLVITVIYYSGFYTVGFLASAVLTIILIVVMPALVVFMVPHLIAGYLGLRE